jgi:hypothetical protein
MDAPRLLISHIFVALDNPKLVYGSRVCLSDFLDPNDLVDSAVIASVHCFGARWLPLMLPQTATTANAELLKYHQHVSEVLWREARDKIESVMNRTSFRLAFAMYLFGMTPVPANVPDNEDIKLAQTSLETALTQCHRLLSGSQVPLITNSDEMKSPTDSFEDLADKQTGMKRIVHWFGIVCDTSASLTLGKAPILTSGSITEEPVWRLSMEWTKSQGAGLLKARSIDGISLLTDGIAHGIVETAGSAKGLTWKAIAALRWALVRDFRDSSVQHARAEVISTMAQFERSFIPLLNIVESQLLFLSQEVQLSWYLIYMHYHLGVLILNEQLEQQYALEVIPNMDQRQFQALYGLVKVFKLAISTPYTFDKSVPMTLDSRQPKCCLISVDPYPHHVVNAVRLGCRSLLGYFKRGVIKLEPFYNMYNILLSALDFLPGSSEVQQRLMRNLRKELDESRAIQQLDSGVSVVPPPVLTNVPSPAPVLSKESSPQGGELQVPIPTDSEKSVVLSSSPHDEEDDFYFMDDVVIAGISKGVSDRPQSVDDIYANLSQLTRPDASFFDMPWFTTG